MSNRMALINMSSMAWRTGSPILPGLSSGSRPYEQIIAVNIQQLVIISSARNPSFRAGFIDRAIVSALWGELVPVIVINKIDLGLGKEVSTAIGVCR